MGNVATWPEVEAKVHWAGNWLPLVIGAVFVAVGVTVMIVAPRQGDDGVTVWVYEIFSSVFAFLGAIALVYGLRRIVVPVRVRCAASGVLAEVSTEPVSSEGSVVCGRLTHELCKTIDGWSWQPARMMQRFDRGFILLFGVPLVLALGVICTGAVYARFEFRSWATAAAIALPATLGLGGTVLVVVSLIMRGVRQRQSRMLIPRGAVAVTLTLCSEPAVNSEDLAAKVEWALGAGDAWQTMTIERRHIAAVQLCPWKFVMQGSGATEQTWAVQGLIVIGGEEAGPYVRLPILLTSDFGGAARLMRRLSEVLDVPYLFSADAVGWKAEVKRAKGREPLRAGGIVL